MTDAPDLDEMLAELTTPHTHRTHYRIKAGETWYGRDHATQAPGLVEQLRGMVPARLEGGRRPGFESRVPVSVEALDTSARIDLAAARWVRDLGEDDPVDTVECLRLLRKLAASLDHCGRRPVDDCCGWHVLERDVRGWWVSARVVSGWDGRPWRPANTCPACGFRGGLRVRLTDQTAVCVECRATWDQASVGVLADHIRAENAGGEATA